MLVKGGKEAAFAGVLENPPSSSFEIMHPAAYMAHVPVPVLRLPDIHPLIDAEYTPYDVGVMGEFDVRILTELFGGQQIAAALTPEWNGGIYYAAQRKSAVTAEEKESTASIGLLYYSQVEERGFGAVVSAGVCGGVAAEVLGMWWSGKKDEADDNEQVYTTNEGDVLLSISGTGVFVSEGFRAGAGAQAARQHCQRAVGCAAAGGVTARDGGTRADGAAGLVAWDCAGAGCRRWA